MILDRQRRLQLEDEILSREELPAFAIAVRDGACPTTEYDHWLEIEMDILETANPTHDEFADGCNCASCLSDEDGGTHVRND